MNVPNITIFACKRPRKNAMGKIVKTKQYTANYICPETGRKRRKFCKSKAKAEEYRQVLLPQFTGERYFNPNTNPTVAEVVDHWLENKRGTVKPQTIRGYLPLIKNIVGPLLQGTPQERVHYALTGEKPHRDSKLLLMLGDYKVSELTTAHIPPIG